MPWVDRRKCARCGVVKPLDAEHFPVRAKNRSYYRGICIKCWERENPPPPEPAHFHPTKLYFMCKKKKAFNSEQTAKNVVIKHALKHRGQRVTSYQCPACLKWHVTTHPRG